MNTIQTRGFVLEARSFAEADKIVQLYTLQWGRIKAVVKGVRKPKSKMASAIDLFTESAFSLHKRPSADLFILTQAKVLNAYAVLKKDLGTITALQVLADLLIQSLHDAEPHPEVYGLLRETLEALGSRGEARELLLVSFVMKFLDLLGQPLELKVCVECETPLERKEAFLIPHRGGALCGDCCPSGPSRLKVSASELEILKKLRALPPEKVPILKVSAAYSRRLFLTALEYLERTNERKLKSVEFYVKMIPTGSSR